MSAIGPIEPAGDDRPPAPPSAAPPSPPDLLDGEPARPKARRNLLLLLATAAALLALAAANLLDPKPNRTPTPAPHRAHVTRISYAGVSGVPDRAARTFGFRIRISVDSGPPATVQSLHHPYAGLTTAARPATPFAVSTGHPRETTLRITVDSCAAPPRDSNSLSWM